MQRSAPSHTAKRVNKAVKSTAKCPLFAADSAVDNAGKSRRPLNSTDSTVSSTASQAVSDDKHAAEELATSSSSPRNGGRRPSLVMSTSSSVSADHLSHGFHQKKRKISTDSLATDHSGRESAESVDHQPLAVQDHDHRKPQHRSNIGGVSSTLNEPTSSTNGGLPASRTSSINKAAAPESLGAVNGLSKRLKSAETPEKSLQAALKSAPVQSFLSETADIVDMFRSEKNAIDRDIKLKMNYALFERTCRALLAKDQSIGCRIQNARTVRDLNKFKRLNEMIDVSSSGKKNTSAKSSKAASAQPVAANKPEKLSVATQPPIPPANDNFLVQPSAHQPSPPLQPKTAASSVRRSTTSSDSLKSLTCSSSNSGGDPAVNRFVQKYNYVYRPTLRCKVETGDDSGGGEKRFSINWTVDRVNSWIHSKLPPPNDHLFYKNISHYELYVSVTRPDEESQWIKIQDIRGGKPPDKCPLVGFDTGHPYRFKIRFIDHDGLASPYSDEVTFCS